MRLSCAWRSGANAMFLALCALLAACTGDPTSSMADGNQGTGNPTGDCPTGWVLCDGVCTDLRSDSSHCGRCGSACGAGLLCSLGACSSSCASGLSQCGNSCVDLQSDSGHCGRCNAPCAGSCSGGSCQGEPGSAGGGANPAAGNAGSTGASGSSGAGGSSAGSGGMSGGTAGAAADAGPQVPSGAFGGYIESGSWQGYAWTATSGPDATISPEDFATRTEFPLCASGSLPAGNSNVAMVGWNLNQATADGEPALPVTPSAAGITVSVDNPGGSELRLQIQGPNGGADEGDRWCAVIPGSGGFIPFDGFNTECWAGGSGTPYAGEPIVAALVLVPGAAASMVSFDFCINELAETDESGEVASQGCSLTGDPGEGGGSISGSETRSVTRDGRQYVVQNNVWNGNAGSQTLSVDGVAFEVTQQGNSASTGGAPASYPSVFIGSNFGRGTTGSNLPRQVSALSSVQTGWRWSSAQGAYNAAYDVWFSTGAGGDANTPSGGYLMVWFNDPDSVQPLGSPQGTVSLAGRSFQVWICSNQSNGCTQNGVPVISYVPTGGTISEWSFDLNLFIQNAVDQFGVIDGNWYLTNIFAGFEIWTGGTGLRTDNFCAVVE